jgi:hypothetical protein
LSVEAVRSPGVPPLSTLFETTEDGEEDTDEEQEAYNATNNDRNFVLFKECFEYPSTEIIYQYQLAANNLSSLRWVAGIVAIPIEAFLADHAPRNHGCRR